MNVAFVQQKKCNTKAALSISFVCADVLFRLFFSTNVRTLILKTF